MIAIAYSCPIEGSWLKVVTGAADSRRRSKSNKRGLPDTGACALDPRALQRLTRRGSRTDVRM